MDDSTELAQLEEKIDQVAQYIQTLRQTNETFKILLVEKEKKIEQLEKTLHNVEERIEHLLNQLPAEK